MPLKDFNTAATLDECSGTPRTALFGAVRAGNLALVLDILKNEPKAVHWQEIRDDLGVFDAYALHVAAKEGQLEIAKALVAAGAFPDARNSGGRSPLIEAIVNGRTAVADYLLAEAKASPNQSCSADITPLMRAAENNDAAIVALLLERGAKIEAAKNGENALGFAVRGNAPDVIGLLIRAGIRHDRKNDEGLDAEAQALDLNRTAIAKLIRACVQERAEELEAQAQEARARNIADMGKGTAAPLTVGKPLRLKGGS